MSLVRGVLLAGASCIALGNLPAQAGTLTQRAPANEPPHVGSQLYPRMAFDAATQRLVHVNSTVLGGNFDTYEYDGVSWALKQRIPCPTFTTSSNVVWDEVLQQCLIATSSGFSVYISAWVAGSGWQVLASAPITPTSYTGVSVAMARDPGNNLCVVIAGTQTFLFLGNLLVPLPAATQATSFAAYDPVRAAVIAVNASQTSWFDGLAWHVLPGYVPHSPEEITTDFVLGRVLAVHPGGLMEWNGWTWADAQILGAPMTSVSMRTIACDANGDAWVLSLPENGVPGGTFVYQELPRVQGACQPIGSGCPGPAGVPLPVFPGYPPRFGRPLLCVVDHVPNGPQNFTMLVVGSDAASWNGQPLPVPLAPFGAPGCEVWLEPIFALPIHGVLQSASHLLAMPASPSVVGQWFRVQYATFVPGWNPMSLITSSAARCKIGTY